MKKLLALAIAAMMVVMVCGCAGKDDKGNTGVNNDGTGTVSSSDSAADSEETDVSVVTEEMLRSHKTSPVSDFEYEIKGDEVEIGSYKGNDAIVVVPDTIEGKKVTKLRWTFATTYSTPCYVKGVYIPNSVKELVNAFPNNKNIQMVICEGVETLSGSCFLGCESLKKIFFTDALSKVDSLSIEVCPELEEMYIGPNVKQIEVRDNAAFICTSCPKLTIKGKSGSFIESYAKSEGINFVAE